MKLLCIALCVLSLIVPTPVTEASYPVAPIVVEAAIAPVPPSRPKITVSRGELMIKIASRYIGGNPTGWSNLWCARFMALVARKARVHVPREENLAFGWLHTGRPGHGDYGDIAILARSGGGHIGLKLGSCGRGSVRLLSGNYGGRVGIGCYPAYRIIAYRNV